MNGPIFLAGQDRTGIGLVGELLDAHPEVAITRRTNFWSFYHGRYGPLGNPANLDACLADMLAYTRIRRLEPDADRLRANLLAGDPTYARLFRLLQEQNLERLGKKRWGDKSLGSERQAVDILAAFPEAVMIHVLRDPRDRYASLATHRSAGRGGVGAGVAAWLWSARTARHNLSRFAGRYRVVRYEDLVADPAGFLGSLSEFLGIDLRPEMLAADPPGPIHERSVGRWRRDLPAGDVRFIEAVAGKEMARWHYGSARPEWEAGELLRYGATGVPRALAGLVLWGPRSRLEEKRAGPSTRRTATV